ncbi:MAG: TIR domain-containing protein [Candidatus Methanoperedens sp.]|nr:TIR domain-containing protein [Candidatus Methanoperedens sp.]
MRRQTIKKSKVFISFHNKDRHAKDLLQAQAKNKNINLQFSDQSVNKPYKSKWKTNTKSKIQKASTTVVMVGKDTYQRKAVDWEIEQSRKAGNKIIAVQIHKDKHHRLPVGVKKSEEVRWKIDTLSRRLKKGK